MGGDEEKEMLVFVYAFWCGAWCVARGWCQMPFYKLLLFSHPNAGITKKSLERFAGKVVSVIGCKFEHRISENVHGASRSASRCFQKSSILANCYLAGRRSIVC